MLEYWDRGDSGRWPTNPSMSPNVSDDPQLMNDVLAQLGKIEPNKESDPWVCSPCSPAHQLQHNSALPYLRQCQNIGLALNSLIQNCVGVPMSCGSLPTPQTPR